MNLVVSDIDEFVVYGTPRPDPRLRARVVRRLGRTTVAVYLPGAVRAWKRAVSVEVKRCCRMRGYDGPVAVELVFYLPSGKKAGRDSIPHLVRPDVDNLTKPVIDAIVESGVIVDDSRIFSVAVSKWKAAAGERPRVHVKLKYVEDARL